MAAAGSTPFNYQARPNPDPQEYYTHIMLCHARLYVFVDCYGVVALMRLARYKLGQTLVRFTLHDERVEDVVKLIEYCFANPTPDDLRSLVSMYAACKVEQLHRSTNFRLLLAAHSELSAALVGALVERLADETRGKSVKRAAAESW